MTIKDRKQTTKPPRIRHIQPLIKICGHKWHIRDWIISHFPKNYESMIYCEPFCGSGSVFLNKKESVEEVMNDIDYGIISIFRALRDDPDLFYKKIKDKKRSIHTFRISKAKSKKHTDDYVEHAVWEFLSRRMSKHGLGEEYSNPKFKIRDLAWEKMKKQLKVIAHRIRNAVILNLDFRELIPAWDEEDTLFYIDPPYFHTCRCELAFHKHDMTEADHADLLHIIKYCRGKVIISGCYCPLYKRVLKNWRMVRKNSVATRRRPPEYLWMNY